MLGRERLDRELLDAMLVCGDLIPEGSVYRFWLSIDVSCLLMRCSRICRGTCGTTTDDDTDYADVRAGSPQRYLHSQLARLCDVWPEPGDTHAWQRYGEPLPSEWEVRRIRTIGALSE